jgi:hypothetical protein
MSNASSSPPSLPALEENPSPSPPPELVAEVTAEVDGILTTTEHVFAKGFTVEDTVRVVMDIMLVVGQKPMEGVSKKKVAVQVVTQLIDRHIASETERDVAKKLVPAIIQGLYDVAKRRRDIGVAAKKLWDRCAPACCGHVPAPPAGGH